MAKSVVSHLTAVTRAKSEFPQASPHTLMVAPDGPSSDISSLTVLCSPRLRRKAIASLTIEAACTVRTLLRHGMASGALACLLSYMFTLGNFLSGKPPVDQTDVAFQTAVGVMITSFYCTSLFVASVLTLGSLHRTDDSELRWGFVQMSVLLLRRTLAIYVLAHILVVWLTYTVVATPDKTVAASRLNMYTNGLIITIYHAGVDEACRNIYRQETVEGRRTWAAQGMPYWKRYLRSLLRTASSTGACFLAAGFLHVCSFLTLETEIALAGFSLASMALKSLVLWVTRHIVLGKKNMKLRTIYAMTAVPTVVINTQMRLFILRSDVASSVRSFLLLAILEPILRVAKTSSMKRKLAERQAESVSSRNIDGSARSKKLTHVLRVKSAKAVAPKEIVVAPVTKKVESTVRTASALLNAPLAWQKSLLTFHAAESHADMCSEYIAIACSMSIYHCFRRHPKFGWHESGMIDGSTTNDTRGRDDIAVDIQQILVIAGYQIVIEMAVDLVCCMWELSHGIPLRTSDRLGGFLTAVFTSCAFVAISITVLLYVHEST